MLLVKTKIGQSNIHGIGLFADEFIPKGTEVWRFVEGFDRIIPEAEAQAMVGARQHFETYCCHLPNLGWLMTADNDRFINHSIDPTLKTNKEITSSIAIRDIFIGEEITEDYREYGEEEPFNHYWK